MQSVWDDIVFVIVITVPFAILWWLSGKLRRPGIGAAFWDGIFSWIHLHAHFWSLFCRDRRHSPRG